MHVSRGQHMAAGMAEMMNTNSPDMVTLNAVIESFRHRINMCVCVCVCVCPRTAIFMRTNF